MNADQLWSQKETEDEERERKKRLLKRIKTDRRYYQSKFLKIKTRDSRIINLNANEAQNRLLLMVEGQEKAGKPVRGVCLKPRRVGCSTEIQAILFQRAATKPNINALTVAHDLDSTQEMFEMDGLFYDELPEDLRPLKRYCVDEQTECLTRRGWQKYDGLLDIDEIYGFNPDTGAGEWQVPRSIYVGEYAGDMIEWKGEDVDALFTPEHKWLLTTNKRRYRQLGVGYRRGKQGSSPRYGFYTSDTAPCEGLIPLSAPMRQGKGLELPTDFLRLLGWVVTEGTFIRENGVRIDQSTSVNSDYCTEIKGLLDSLGFEYSDHIYPSGIQKFNLMGDSAKIVRRYLPDKRFRWDDITLLNADQAAAMIEAIRHGDGRRSGHFTIWSADRELLDQYQTIATIAGIHAKVSFSAKQRLKRRRALKRYGDLWQLSCSKVNEAWVQYLKQREKRVAYNGVIWCPDLPTHVMIARRNGKVYITGQSNRKELVFENPDDVSRRIYPGLRSKLRVATSSDEELGRSKEIHLLHASEVAFWDKADTTMLSLCNAVSANPHTMIFKESTPNGVGNYFYREYKQAKAGKSDYFAYFMAWFEFHAHQRPLDGPPEAFEDTIDDEEKEMQEKYSLTLEQLNWRRWAIRELCGGDGEKFKQEYPSNDTECFLLSGRHVFDSKVIQKLLLGNLYDPPFRGRLIPAPSHPARYRLDPNDKGELKIWKLPRMGRRYIIGADVAEGLEHGDFSTAPVHDWETFEEVAAWHGHIASDLFGDRLGELGHFYGDALIACEDNIGTPNKRLRALGYPHLYYRQEQDDRIRRRTQKLGWLTTSLTKPVMIDNLQQALRDGAEIPDQELVDEIATFIYKKDGSMGGEGGCFDDRVMGSACAAAARLTWGISRFFPSPRKT